MTAKAAIQWARKEDERWAAAFRLHLVMRSRPPKGLAEQALCEIHERVTEAGRPAEDLFGDPRRYAASVAAVRIDEAHTDAVDPAGATPGERFTDAVVLAGFTGFTLTAVRWARDGSWLGISPASLAGAVAITAVALLLCLTVALRAAGRMRAARVCLGVLAAGAVGGTAAASLLPGDVLFSLPVPVPLVVSALVAVGAHRLPDATADRWFTPRPAEDGEQWLRHLDGLLRGRHGLSAEEAREHVAEARSHLADARGRTAQHEFGDVATYAARLADGPRRARRAQHRKAHAAGAFAVAIAVANADALRSLDMTSFWFWFGLLATAFAAAQVALRYRDFRREER